MTRRPAALTASEKGGVGIGSAVAILDDKSTTDLPGIRPIEMTGAFSGGPDQLAIGFTPPETS